MWYEKIIQNLESPQVINDSKTPSGRVHVGSLRGVLIHDAVYRAMLANSIDVTYLYGIDDYDPMDGLPADTSENLKQYMGLPLCNVPAPTGSDATDLADHYIREFLSIFPELGVKAIIYRTRDLYRCGGFNESINAILSKSDVVRQIYANVSNSTKPSNWHPFQVVCEECGRIGTTEVTDYDGKEVTYECKSNLVTWATGCGYKGKVSPFDGRGKLPWKLEWAAKWHLFAVTVEGAGKDHCTKGGSMDVSSHILSAIFGRTPPVNIPYEFFLVRGAKMSSSKGIGTSARDIANFLPPEILRFLMIRTQPKRTVNFSTDLDYIVKLFNEHDRILEKCISQNLTQEDDKLLKIFEVDPGATYYKTVNFQLLTALLQLPHVDVETEVLSRMNNGFSDTERRILHRRIESATYWLEHFAADEERITLQREIPKSAYKLTVVQRMFLRKVADRLSTTSENENELQQLIFHIARLTPISQKDAFLAIYIVLLDRKSGPKGGSLLAYLDSAFLKKRFNELEISVDDFWNETGITQEDCSAWLRQHKATIVKLKAETYINVIRCPGLNRIECGRGVVEMTVFLKDGKSHLKRVLISDIEAIEIDDLTEMDYIDDNVKEYMNELETQLGVPVQLIVGIKSTEEAKRAPEVRQAGHVDKFEH